MFYVLRRVSIEVLPLPTSLQIQQPLRGMILVGSTATNFHHSHRNIRELNGVVGILCHSEGIKGDRFGSGSSHATNFHHSILNRRDTHAPQNETEWWGDCATWEKYKAAAFGSGASHATNFHHAHLNPRGTHAPQNETEWWGYCATWGKYKAAAFGSGSSHATYFHHSHLNPRVSDCVPSEDVDNPFPRGDLEILTGSHRRSTHEDFTQNSTLHLWRPLTVFLHGGLRNFHRKP
ncbi:hypothetical protein HZH68_015945 [Vespula germanica]|uniref:Uncharacterized protein n=1 Tax=Vespula germanica TaxID=30212 RepID=A0A834J400_VESGE|nr:hypothetical protein HZH68_015945 [Vespula germanica]